MDYLPLSDIPMLVSSIASYVNAMSPTLYKALSQGNDAYLKEHSTFGAQFIEIQDFFPGPLPADAPSFPEGGSLPCRSFRCESKGNLLKSYIDALYSFGDSAVIRLKKRQNWEEVAKLR